MKFKNKVLVSALGLSALAVTVPVVLTSCNSEQPNQPGQPDNKPESKKYELFDLDNCEKSINGDFSHDKNEYIFFGQLSKESFDITNDEWINKYGFKESADSTKDNFKATNENFANLELFKKLLTIDTLSKDNFDPKDQTDIEHVNGYFKDQKEKSFLNPFITHSEKDKKIQYEKEYRWVSQSDVSFNLSLDKISTSISYNNSTFQNLSEKYIQIKLNNDRKHSWDNKGDTSPIWIILMGSH